MPRKPLGTYARSTGDWYQHGARGFAFQVSAAAAQFSYIGLFNNSTTGAYLFVLALNAWATNSSSVVLEYTQGSGGLTLQTTQQMQVDPLSSVIAGQLFTGHTAVCIGTEFYWISNPASPSVFDWQHDFPIAAIPPGWMFTVHPTNTNCLLNVGMMWIALQE